MKESAGVSEKLVSLDLPGIQVATGQVDFDTFIYDVQVALWM